MLSVILPSKLRSFNCYLTLHFMVFCVCFRLLLQVFTYIFFFIAVKTNTLSVVLLEIKCASHHTLSQYCCCIGQFCLSLRIGHHSWLLFIQQVYYNFGGQNDNYFIISAGTSDTHSLLFLDFFNITIIIIITFITKIISKRNIT